MFEEIKTLLTIYNSNNKNRNSIHLKGQIIQYLKRIAHFRIQVDNYGADILELYLPLLEPYLIREGSQFIDDSENFVIVEGIIKKNKTGKVHLGLEEVFTDGALIDASAKKDGETLMC